MNLHRTQGWLLTHLPHGLFICCVFFASMYIAFWRQITTGFAFNIGDGYDGVIENVITTHWYWVLQGKRVWNEAGYFFPYADTLGYNDSYLIYGLIASIFRIFTENQFLAVELAHVSIRAIGFFSFYKLARHLGVSRMAAVFGAALFTIAFSATDNGHAQFLLVSISPLLFYFLAQTLYRFNKIGFFKYAALTSVTYGMMALTGFYMTYFSTLFILTVLLGVLVCCPSLLKTMATPGALKRFLAGSMLFAASISPFLGVYLPKLQETGGHPFTEIQKGMPHPQDIINIGDKSFLWGTSVTEVFSDAGLPFAGGEMQHGFGLLLLATFICSTLYVLWRQTHESHKGKTPLRLIIALSTVFWMLAIIDFGKGGLWSYVYAYVPGSKGLRIVSRMYLFLALPASLVIAMAFDIISKNLKSIVGKLVIVFFAMLTLVEQVNTYPHVSLDTKEQLHFLKALPAPPEACKYFYARNPSGYSFGDDRTDQYYRVNVRAMLVSSYLNLPTLIGFASFTPPDWNFIYAPESTFDNRVYHYAVRHRVTENLCVLDIKSKSWSMITDAQ